MKLSISRFFKYLKIKRKINNKSDFTTNEITKIKISLVDFHRKLNLLEKDDVVLIANHGIWGERAMDMAKRQGRL